MRNLIFPLILCFCFGLSLFTPASLRAEEPLPLQFRPKEYEPLRVLLPPSISFYKHLDAPPISPDFDPNLVQKSIQNYLDRHPYFEVIPGKKVFFERLGAQKGVRTGLRKADEERRDGLRAFFQLNFSESTAHLNFASNTYRRHYGELLDPEGVSEVALHLALAWIEQQNLGQIPESERQQREEEIDQLLLQFVRLAPQRTLDSRRHTPVQVKRYRQARRLFLREPMLRLGGYRKQAQTLARVFGGELDLIFFAHIAQRESGALFLELLVYNITQGNFSQESIPLSQDTEIAQEQADALISRLASCYEVRPAPPFVDKGERGRLYVDIAFSYLQFFERPTREPFDNIGGSFGGALMLTEHFSAFTRLDFSFSGRDTRGDLLSTFNTARSIIGVGLSRNFEWIRIFFETGVEITAISNFSASTNLVCKTYLPGDIECPPGAVKNFNVGAIGGLNGALGFNLGFDPIFLVTRINASFYLIPFNEARVLNFPLGVEFGVQYRFF